MALTEEEIEAICERADLNANAVEWSRRGKP